MNAWAPDSDGVWHAVDSLSFWAKNECLVVTTKCERGQLRGDSIDDFEVCFRRISPDGSGCPDCVGLLVRGGGL